MSVTSQGTGGAGDTLLRPPCGVVVVAVVEEVVFALLTPAAPPPGPDWATAADGIMGGVCSS